MTVPRPALRTGFWVLRSSALGSRFPILGIRYCVLGLGSGCPIATSALSFFITSHVTSGLLKRHALRVPVDYIANASTSSQTSSSQCPLVSLLSATPRPLLVVMAADIRANKRAIERTNRTGTAQTRVPFLFTSPPPHSLFSHRSPAVRLGLHSVCPHV